MSRSTYIARDTLQLYMYTHDESSLVQFPWRLWKGYPIKIVSSTVDPLWFHVLI